MQFQFSAPQKILFGAKVAETLSAHALTFGRRALVVTGANQARFSPFLTKLEAAGLEAHHRTISGEPEVQTLVETLRNTDRFSPELVIAIGGGSALDFGKALAALSGLGADPFDYLEVVGRGKKLPRHALPVIAVPTTSGPGSEATKNAVLTAEQGGAKVSLRDDSMLPRVALVDPLLTLSVPRAVTAATGLDAITQCLEPLVSRLNNPLLDPLAMEGLVRGFRALPTVLASERDIAGRTELAYCSLAGGLSLANAKLGAVHGFSAPIGGMFKAPHGAVCARLLPLVVEANIGALRSRRAEHPALKKFAAIARSLTGDESAEAEDAVRPLSALVELADIPGFGAYGIGPESHALLVERAKRASSMAGNPIELTDEELHGILERAQ